MRLQGKFASETTRKLKIRTLNWRQTSQSRFYTPTFRSLSKCQHHRCKVACHRKIESVARAKRFRLCPSFRSARDRRRCDPALRLSFCCHGDDDDSQRRLVVADVRGILLQATGLNSAHKSIPDLHALKAKKDLGHCIALAFFVKDASLHISHFPDRVRCCLVIALLLLLLLFN